MKSIKIIEAKYLNDYRILLIFSDNSEKIIDFAELLRKSTYPNEKKYLDKNIFKQFKVDYGDLIWNDFDMCFQAKNLYKGMTRL
ncbi:MAG: DUF2442 domain-containing protein [FCB group bacterium]|jgi:hypothetical protein